MKNLFRHCFFILTLSLTLPALLTAQNQSADNIRKLAPRIFIDCDRCDVDYIREEINYVNYVWDRKNADVHVLITQQGSGGGGREYTLNFIGLSDYSAVSDTVTFSTDQTMTDDEVRTALVEQLEIGLLPYVQLSPIADHITVSVNSDFGEQEVEDQWNYWVFEIGLFSSLEGEESQNEVDIFSDISAERVTPELKMDFRAYGNLEREEFTYFSEDAGEEITTVSRRDRWGASAEIVKSISSHWSYALFSDVNSSTFSNIQRRYRAAPGIEYNIFPYAESTRREIRTQLRMGYLYNRYFEETIFLKTEEGHTQAMLFTIAEFTQPWGETEISLEAAAFLNDFEKNHLELDAELEIRIVKGLSLDINGRYSVINDQISLPASDYSPEEILTGQVELATSYRYDVRLGLSYAFGSIYNNVVNPRFEMF
jgi:hypothetical protein